MRKQLERYILRIIKGEVFGFPARLVSVILSLLEIVYVVILKIRKLLYRFGIIKAKGLDTPVISIGNITTGGTGKTPLVEKLAEELKKEGYSPAVVSRGYRSEGDGPLIVSDGKEILAGINQAGDEVYMLAQHLHEIPVVCGKDRVETAKLVEREFSPDIIIADDAFQHWPLKRDLDLVVIDAINPFGYNHLLPRGLLREPLTALERADVFIITRSQRVSAEELNKLKGRLKSYNSKAEIILSQHRPVQLDGIACSREEGIYSPEELDQRRVLALSGIGSPDSFVQGLNELKAQVVETMNYPDHYKYSEDDIMDIAMKAQLKDIDWVVTTEKDAVKFNQEMRNHFRKMEVELYSLDINLNFKSDRWIQNIFKLLESRRELL